MVLFLLCFYLGDDAELIVSNEENKGLWALERLPLLMHSCRVVV